MTTYTLPFQAIHAADIAKVGGKGANLGEMTNAGFNIPPGFCVTTAAFTRFMSAAKTDIYASLESITADDVEHLRLVGEKVRAALNELPFPQDVADAVTDAWLALGEQHAYAVRSSATAEDLPGASFAGQQDTYLNIRGKSALLKSVKACFISLFTDRAILYRVQNGFDHRNVALAVVVQRMVQPDVAGILFTADPVTGNRNIVSIDASFGLGEALVSGLVSADLYQVDKREHKIIKRQIAKKTIAIRSLSQGGTEQIDLPESEQMQAALTDAQVLELARLGGKIEAHYGVPQDIEWALSGEDLYITQSRPITSLFPLPKQDNADFRVYASLSHFQMMTDAMPPLALSALRLILPGSQGKTQPESKYVLDIGGRIYADVSPILRNPIGRRVLPRAFKNIEELGALAIAELANDPRLRTKKSKLDLRAIKVIFPYVGKVMQALWRADPDGASAEAMKVINTHIAATDSRLRAAPDIQAKLDIVVSDAHQILLPALTWMPKLIAGIISTVAVTKLMQKKGNTDDIIALGRGLTGNVVTDMGLAVGDLSDAALASEALAKHLSNPNITAKVRVTTAVDFTGGEAFVTRWNQFMTTYGVRGPAEINLSRPRWSEDPTSLLQMVVNGLDQREIGAHWAHFNQLQAAGELAAQRLTKLAHQGLLGWVRGPLVARLIRVSRALSPLREHHKFLAVKFLALIKQVLLDAGEQLQAAGKLESSDDIWFLTFPDVIEAFGSTEPLRALIKDRRADFEHYKQLSPPRVITSEGDIPIVKLDGGEAPEGALLGSPVSAGVVEGIAKVIHNPSVEALAPGEILVAPFTDPGWTPLFVNAAGLVTEVGGLMSHGSVIAREYGIPAVVGVVDATSKIKTGQRIRVHGAAGYIELLNDETEG